MSRAPFARLIVCEPAGRWAILLRRFAPDLDVTEARSLALASDLLRESPASFVCVAATAENAASALPRLGEWSRDFPAASFAILADEEDNDLELAFREAGAQLVLTSVFELPVVAAMARRHFAQVRPPQLDWREAIEARMPW